jgi:hypothetical protein
MNNKSSTLFHIASAPVAMALVCFAGLDCDQALIIGAVVSLCLGWYLIRDDRYMRINLLLLLLLPAVPAHCFPLGIMPQLFEVDWHLLRVTAWLVAAFCLLADWYAVISDRNPIWQRRM